MKLIIPVAGYGTRFLPATKAMPKEMLPVIDKPVIQYVVEEAVSAGFKDIILVTGPGKSALENHFDTNPGLERHLKKFGKKQALKQIQKISKLANIIYIRQKGPYGNGTPILNCKPLINENAFAVVWGDEIWISKKPRLRQLLDIFNKYNKPVIAGYSTDTVGTTKYGIINGKEISKGIYQVKRILEKPGPKRTRSRLASLGGYILTSEIFDLLEKRKKSLKTGKELYLSEAIDDLLKIRDIYAKKINIVKFLVYK